jgi:hypothetical protein
MKRLLLLLLLTSLSQLIVAQTDTTEVRKGKKPKKEKKVYLVVLPALASNPTSGFMYGISGTAAWFMGPKVTTHMSEAMAAIIYTTKQQSINLFKSNMFLKNDSWILKGDWRFFLSSSPTYGLGTGPQSAKPVGNGNIEYSDDIFSEPIPDDQMMEFYFIRFHETVLRRYKDTRFFAGLGYHLDYHYQINDHLLDLEADTPVITSHYGYSELFGFDPEKYTLSGISANFIYDSRDNPVFPTDGRYAFISYRMNPEFLGSSKNSTLLWLEYRDYFNLSKKVPRHLIGIWFYGNFVTSGDVPYMDLPAVGWDQFGKSGRAYTQGRFRGLDLLYFETEYRFPIPIFKKHPDLLGGVAFVNATTADNRGAQHGFEDYNIDLFDYVDPGYGIGLRVMVNKKSKSCVTLDYAWGKYGAQGFWFGFNETF